MQMKKNILLTLGVIVSICMVQAQNLQIHKKDGSMLEIPVDCIDSLTFSTNEHNIYEFCEATPIEWSCELFQNSFDTLPIPDDYNSNRLYDPIAIVRYSCDTISCNYGQFPYLHIYDISEKDTLEQIIFESAKYSWCIPIFFGENEKYYVISSPCYLNNICWANHSLEPLYQAIKGLFLISIIE